MTYREFKNYWLGRGIDFDKHYGNQCVDVYRQYCKSVLKIPQSAGVKGAKDIWTTYLKEHFVRIKNTIEGIPRQGSVIIWGMGKYGHVGICDKATQKTVTCFEQNWKETGTSKDGKGVTEIRQHNYKNILGWLVPKVYNEPEEQNMTKDEERALKAIKKFKETESKLQDGNLEGAVNAGVGAYRNLKTVRKLLKTSESLQKSAEKTAKRLVGELASKTKECFGIAKEIKTAKKKITNLKVKLEAEKDMKNKYRKYWDRAKENDITKMTAGEAITVWLKARKEKIKKEKEKSEKLNNKK